MTSSLFVPDGDRWLPTELARGPWDPGALHGGPVAALLARAAEAAAPGGGTLRPARLTAELLRPVLLTPLAVTSRVVRPGRKVALVEAEIASDQGVVARALVLFIRSAPIPVPDSNGDPAPPPPHIGQALVPWAPDEETAFHNAGVEHSFVAGDFATPGPATDWIRLAVPVVPGEEPSPLQRTVTAADFGNGISGVLEQGRHLFINPDLTVHLHRLPEGEWICLDAATHLGTDGIGLAESALYDQTGDIGRSVQSLLIDVMS